MESLKMKSNARKSTYSGKPSAANQEQLRMRQALKPESIANHVPVKASPTTWKRSGWSLSARVRHESKEELLTPMVISRDSKGRLNIASSNYDVSGESANAENVASSEKKSPDQRSLWSLFSTPKVQDTVGENTSQVDSISNGSSRVHDEELTPHHVQKVPLRDPRIRKREESENKKSPSSFNLFSKMKPLKNASRNFFAHLGKKPDVSVSQDLSATSEDDKATSNAQSSAQNAANEPHDNILGNSTTGDSRQKHIGDNHIENDKKADNYDQNCIRPSANPEDNNMQSLNKRLSALFSDAESVSVNQKQNRDFPVAENVTSETTGYAKEEDRTSMDIMMPTLTLPADIEQECFKSNMSSEPDESECLFIDEQASADCPSDINEDSGKIQKEEEESHVLRVWSLQSEGETNSHLQNVDTCSSFSADASSFLDDSLPLTGNESLNSLDRSKTENTMRLGEELTGDGNSCALLESSGEKTFETTNAAQRSAQSSVFMIKNFEEDPPKLQAQPNTHHLLQELDSLLECSTYQSDPHSSMQPESNEETSGINSLDHSRESDSSNIAEPARNIFSLFGSGKKSLSPINIVKLVEHQPIEQSANSSYRSALSKDAIVLSGSCSGERNSLARTELPEDNNTVNTLLSNESPDSGLQTLSSNMSLVAPVIALSCNESADTSASLPTSPSIKSTDTCIPSLTPETGTGYGQGNEQNLRSSQPPELCLEVNPSSSSLGEKEISRPSPVTPVPEEDNVEDISFLAFETRNDLCSYSKTMKLKMQRKTSQTGKAPAKKCVYPVVKNVKMKKRKKNPIEAKIKALEQDLLWSMESRGLTEIVHPGLSRKGVALDRVKKNDLVVNVRNEELERISHKSKKSKHKKRHRSKTEVRPSLDVRWPGKHSNPLEISRATHSHSLSLLVRKSIEDKIHGTDHVRKREAGHSSDITMNHTTSSDTVKVVGLEHGQFPGLQKNISKVHSFERSDGKTEIKKSKPKHSLKPQEWEIFSEELPALSERPSLKLKFISKAKMTSPTKVEQSPHALSTKPRESTVPLKSPSSHIPVNVQQLHVPSPSATTKSVVPMAPKPVEEKAQPSSRLPEEESLPFKPFEKPVASKKSAFVSDALEDLLQGAGINKQMKPLISPSTMSVSNAKVVFKVPSKQSHSVKTLDMALKRQKPVNVSSPTYDKMGLGFKDSHHARDEKKKKKKKKKKKHKDRPKEEKVKKGYVFGTGPGDLVRRLPNLPFTCYGKTLARPLFARQQQVSNRVGEKSKGFLEVRNVLSLSGKTTTKRHSDEVEVQSIKKIKQEPEEIDEMPSHINENLPPILNINLPYSGKDGKLSKEEDNMECAESQRKEGQASSETNEVKKCGEYCRLGCICSSLNDSRTVQERSSHCRKVDCMFDCVCKRFSTQTISSTRIRRPPTFAQDMLFYDDSYKFWKNGDNESSTAEAKKLQLLDHLPTGEKRNLVSTCARTRHFVTDKPEKWIKWKRKRQGDKPDKNYENKRPSESSVALPLASEGSGAHSSNENQGPQNDKQHKSRRKQQFIPLSVPSGIKYQNKDSNQASTVKNIPAQSTATLSLAATSSQGNADTSTVMSTFIPVAKQYLLNGNVMNMVVLPNGNRILLPASCLPNTKSTLNSKGGFLATIRASKVENAQPETSQIALKLAKPTPITPVGSIVQHQEGLKSQKAKSGSSVSSVTSGFQKPVLPVRYQITSSGIAISPAPVASEAPTERSNISQGTISLAIHGNPGILQTPSASTNSRFHTTVSQPGDVASVSSKRTGSDIRQTVSPQLNSPGVSAQPSVLVNPPVAVKAPIVTSSKQNDVDRKSAPVEGVKSVIDMQKKPSVKKHEAQAKSASHEDQEKPHSPSSNDILGDSETSNMRITKTFFSDFGGKQIYSLVSTDTDFQWTSKIENVVKQAIAMFCNLNKPEGSAYVFRDIHINLLSKSENMIRLSLTLHVPAKKNIQVVAHRREPTCSNKENVKGDEQVMADGRESTCSNKENVKGDEQVMADGKEPTCSNKENVMGDEQVMADGREPTCSNKEHVKGDEQVMADGREPTCGNKENVKGDDQIRETKAHLSNQVQKSHSPSRNDILGDSEASNIRITKTFFSYLRDIRIYTIVSTAADFKWTSIMENEVKQAVTMFYDLEKPEGSVYVFMDIHVNILSKRENVIRLSLTRHGPAERTKQVMAHRREPTCSNKENVKGDDQIRETKAHLSNQVHSCPADTPNASEGGTLEPIASTIGLTGSIATPLTTEDKIQINDKSSNISKDAVASHASNEHVHTMTPTKTHMTPRTSQPSSKKTKATSNTLDKASSSSASMIETSKKLSSSLPEFAKLSEIVKRTSVDEDDELSPTKKITRNNYTTTPTKTHMTPGTSQPSSKKTKATSNTLDKASSSSDSRTETSKKLSSSLPEFAKLSEIVKRTSVDEDDELSPTKKIIRNSSEWLQDPTIQKPFEMQRYSGVRGPWFTTEKEGVKVVLLRDKVKRSPLGKGGKSPAIPKQKGISKRPSTTSSLVTSPMKSSKCVETAMENTKGDESKTHKEGVEDHGDIPAHRIKIKLCEDSSSDGEKSSDSENQYYLTESSGRFVESNANDSESTQMDDKCEDEASEPLVDTSKNSAMSEKRVIDGQRKQQDTGIDSVGSNPPKVTSPRTDVSVDVGMEAEKEIGIEDTEGTLGIEHFARFSEEDDYGPLDFDDEMPVSFDLTAGYEDDSSSIASLEIDEGTDNDVTNAHMGKSNSSSLEDLVKESPESPKVKEDTQQNLQLPTASNINAPTGEKVLSRASILSCLEDNVQLFSDLTNQSPCPSPKDIQTETTPMKESEIYPKKSPMLNIKFVATSNENCTSPVCTSPLSDVLSENTQGTSPAPTKSNDSSEAGLSDTEITPTKANDPSEAGLSDAEIAPTKSIDPSEADLLDTEIGPTKGNDPSEADLSDTEIAPTKSIDPSEAGLSDTEIAPTKSNDLSEAGLSEIEIAPTKSIDMSGAGLSDTEIASTKSSDPSKAGLLDTEMGSTKGNDSSVAGLSDTEIAPTKSNDLSEANLSDTEIDVVNTDDDEEIDVETVSGTTQMVQNIDPYSSLRDITSRLSSALQKELWADVPKKSKRRSSNSSSIKLGPRMGSPRKLTPQLSGPLSRLTNLQSSSSTVGQSADSLRNLAPKLSYPLSRQKDFQSSSNTLGQSMGSVRKSKPQLAGPLSRRKDLQSSSSTFGQSMNSARKSKPQLAGPLSWRKGLQSSSNALGQSMGSARKSKPQLAGPLSWRKDSQSSSSTHHVKAKKKKSKRKSPVCPAKQWESPLFQVVYNDSSAGEESSEAKSKRDLTTHNLLERRRREELKKAFKELSNAVHGTSDHTTPPKVTILKLAMKAVSELKDKEKELLKVEEQCKKEQRRLVYVHSNLLHHARCNGQIVFPEGSKLAESMERIRSGLIRHITSASRGGKDVKGSLTDLQGKGTKRKAESVERILGKARSIAPKKESRTATYDGSCHMVIKDMRKESSSSSHSEKKKSNKTKKRFKKGIRLLPVTKKDMEVHLRNSDSAGAKTSVNTVLKGNQGTSESALDFSMPSGSQGFLQSRYGPYHVREDDSSNDEESLPIDCYVSSSDEPEEDEVDFGLDDDGQYSDDGFIPESEDESNANVNDGRGALSDNDDENKGDKSDQEIVTINIDLDDFEHGTAESRNDMETNSEAESRKRAMPKVGQISQRKEESSLESHDSDDDVLVISEEPFDTDDTLEKKQKERGKVGSQDGSTVGERTEFQSQSKAMNMPKQDTVTNKDQSIPAVSKTTLTSRTNSTKVNINPTEKGFAKEQDKAPLVNVIDEIVNRLKGDAQPSPVSSVEEKKTNKYMGPGSVELDMSEKLTSAALTSAVRATIAALDDSDSSSDDELHGQERISVSAVGVASSSFKHTEGNVSAISVKPKGDVKPSDVMLDSSESSSDEESTTAATSNSTQHEEGNASAISRKHKDDVQPSGGVLDNSDDEMPSTSYTKDMVGVSNNTQLVEENNPVVSPQKKTRVLPMKGALADLISSVKTRVENDDASDSSDDSEIEGGAVSEDEDSDDDSNDEESSDDEEKEEEEAKEDIAAEDNSTSIDVESEKQDITVINKDVAGPSYISGETGQRVENSEFNSDVAGSSKSAERNEEGREKLDSNCDDEAVTDPTSISEGKGQGTEKLDKNSVGDDLTSPPFSAKGFDGGSEVQHGYSVGEDSTDDDDAACLTYAAMGNDEDNEALFDAEDPTSPFSPISLDMNIASDDDFADTLDDLGDVPQSSSHLPPKASATIAGTSTDETKPRETSSQAEQPPGGHQTPSASSKPDLTLDEAISFLNVEKNSDGTLNVFLKGDYNDEKLDELFEKPEVMDYIMSAAAKKD